jgi:hypothetical protein
VGEGADVYFGPAACAYVRQVAQPEFRDQDPADCPRSPQSLGHACIDVQDIIAESFPQTGGQAFTEIQEWGGACGVAESVRGGDTEEDRRLSLGVDPPELALRVVGYGNLQAGEFLWGKAEWALGGHVGRAAYST